MTREGQFVLDFLREYGPTSLAIFDLFVCETHKATLHEEIEYLLNQDLIVTCEGRKVGGKRPIPAFALRSQVR
jgi:hypothetical protein